MNLYTAIPIKGNPAIDLDKQIRMSWVSIGLYVFLCRNSRSLSVAEIADGAYGISHAAILLALHELIDQGLVTEQIVEEAIASQGGAA
jgi:predicted DNA-binding transcriptional regulator